MASNSGIPPGVAASIGNAVHDATGWRPYELPIRPDRLLEGMRT